VTLGSVADGDARSPLVVLQVVVRGVRVVVGRARGDGVLQRDADDLRVELGRSRVVAVDGDVERHIGAGLAVLGASEALGPLVRGLVALGIASLDEGAGVLDAGVLHGVDHRLCGGEGALVQGDRAGTAGEVERLRALRCDLHGHLVGGGRVEQRSDGVGPLVAEEPQGVVGNSLEISLAERLHFVGTPSCWIRRFRTQGL